MVDMSSNSRKGKKWIRPKKMKAPMYANILYEYFKMSGIEGKSDRYGSLVSPLLTKKETSKSRAMAKKLA